jgi:hypothetical protein
LAEAGLTPVSAHARCLSSPQEDRWKELKSLYEQYLNRLAAVGLEDSDAAHIRVAKMGIVPENIGHVIVAGVPDLNPITEAYLLILESTGVAVTVLIDAPDCELEQFDAWGRPDPKAWSQRFLPLRLEDFVVAADPVSEAQIVARLIGSAAVGVCVADSELVPFHLRAMRKRGLKPYDPAGKSLAPFECATLARLWLAFASNGRVVNFASLEHRFSCACSVARIVSLHRRPFSSRRVAGEDFGRDRMTRPRLSMKAAQRFVDAGLIAAVEAQTNIRRVRIIAGLLNFFGPSIPGERWLRVPPRGRRWLRLRAF